MFFKLSALAAVATLASLSVPAAAAPSDVAALDKRLSIPAGLAAVYYCFDVNFLGDCAFSPFNLNLDSCTDVPLRFNDEISAFQIVGLPLLGGRCVLYTEPGCSGSTYTLTAPISDLRTVYFNDVLSSYECSILGGP